MIAAMRAAWLRFLIKSGEAQIEHLRGQIAANEADVAELRVRLAVVEAEGVRA